MKNRFYLLGLSFLVLIVALAGLLGILDTLPKPAVSQSSQDGSKPTPTQSSPAASKPTPSQPSPSGNKPIPSQGDTPSTGTQPADSISKNDTIQKNASLAAGFSLKNPMPPHIPLFEVTGAANTAYLKSQTASFFNGREWQGEGDTQSKKYKGETLTTGVVSYNRQAVDDISITSLLKASAGTVALPTSLYPLRVTSPASLLYYPEEQVFSSEDGFPNAYTFRTVHYSFTDSVLLNAKADLQDKYLQLPSGITPRTRELANTITKGLKTPYQKAKAIENYLKTNYVYDFDYKRAPDTWEPNDWFLFEDKRGVCGNFNSAFVVLCRAAGIPARLVSGFMITPQAEKQVVYQDQGHAWSEVKFQDMGWYTFDATASFRLLPTVTEITSAGPVTRKGHDFNIQGTVQTEKGIPAEGVLVEVFINDRKDIKGGTLIGKGIASQGRFDIQATIPEKTDVGDYHVLAHCLKSTRYLESWSDPLLKVVTATNLSLQVPPRINIRETLSLTGSLTEEFGRPLGGQPIDVYLNGAPVARLVTDSAGRFAWGQAFNEAGTYTLRVSFPGTDYYLKSSQEAVFKVLSPAAIELNVEDSAELNGARVGEPVSASGQLTEQTTGIPLPGRGISVSIDGVPLDMKLVTDSAGRFEFKHIFDKIGDHRIEVKFAEDSDYREADSAVDLKVSPPSGFSLWKIIIIVLALAAAGVGGWFLYRWLKNRPALPAAVAVTAEKEALAPPPPPWHSSDAGLSLTIELPQITDPFPDVWGVGEELTIVCRLTDEIGSGLTARPLDIYINHEPIAHPSTGTGGTAELNQVFPAKGQYELAARFEEGPGLKKASAGRPVRIVDYREEIVSLFDALLNRLRELGMEISEESTPREIENLVRDAKMGIPEKALNDAVSCFEETDYSLHAINRHNYQTMYLAQREIREHGTKPAAVAA